MSNHRGSYMLHDVLAMLDRHAVFDILDSDRTTKLIHDVLKLGQEYDCNMGEILEGLGERFGICYSCRSNAEHLEDGLCEKCLGH